MFWVNSHPAAALARVQAIDTLHSGNEEMVRQQIQKFISKQLLPGEKIDLLITGENGDNRLLKYYTAAETIAGNQVPVARGVAPAVSFALLFRVGAADGVSVSSRV